MVSILSGFEQESIAGSIALLLGIPQELPESRVEDCGKHYSNKKMEEIENGKRSRNWLSGDGNSYRC
jgi:hypothetical protein